MTIDALVFLCLFLWLVFGLTTLSVIRFLFGIKKIRVVEAVMAVHLWPMVLVPIIVAELADIIEKIKDNFNHK